MAPEQEGDVVFLQGKGEAVVRRLVLENVETEVCNLTISELHSFAVGSSGLLVHNTSGTGAVAPNTFPRGSFSVWNWTGYPVGAPKPTGPFRLLSGAEYDAARKAANKANEALRKANPSKYAGKQIHEIHPVKYGGSPIDQANKIPLDPEIHRQFNAWWYRLQNLLE